VTPSTGRTDRQQRSNDWNSGLLDTTETDSRNPSVTFSPPYSITSAEDESLGTGFRDTVNVGKTLTTSFVQHLKGRNTGNNTVPVDRSGRDKTTLTEGAGSYMVKIAETPGCGHKSIRCRSLVPKGRNPMFDLVED
jgi:hypothetical protein